MTTIRARCPHCGEVDMAPDAIELAVRGETGMGSYRFICPACLTLVQKRADRKIVELLSSVGVNMDAAPSPSLLDGPDGLEALDRNPSSGQQRMVEVPFEPRRPSQVGLAPLTYDDLISFHFLLEDDEWLAEMAKGDAPDPGRRRRPHRG